MDEAGADKERAPEGLECNNKKEDASLNTEHFVVHADAAGGNGTGSSMPSVFQSTAIKEVEDNLGTKHRISIIKEVEEDGRYCTLQATGSASQDSVALDGQLDLASVCGRLSNFLSDTKAVPPLSVVEFAQEPTAQSQFHEQCQRYCSDGIEKEAKKKSKNRSGMCSDKAPGAIPGDLCRQDVCGPATHRSSKCTSGSVVDQQSYNMSSVLECGSSHDGTKGKKKLFENPVILPPVRKKLRTFYNAEQLEELEKMFQEDHYPDNEKRKEIAAVVGVTPQRIMVWFQNRRAKWRKLEKLSVKSNKKHPTSSALPPLLPMPPLPDTAQDQSAVLDVDTTGGNYSSLLSGYPAPLASSSVSSVVGMVTSCEAVQTKALPQLNFSFSRMECFPSLPSPPPIRRASLPLSLAVNLHNHVVPLMLDTPNSEYCFSCQQNGSRETFMYSTQNQGLTSSVPFNYPEELESTGNLEDTYCPYSSQDGIYQQHQLSQFHHLPAHLTSNVLSSVHLSPTASIESHTAFLALPGNSGVVTHGAPGTTQAYVQSHMGEQFLLQQPSGNSAGIPAYPAVLWNDSYMQGAPFSNQLCSRVPFSSTAGGKYFTEQTSYAQPPCLPSSPHFQVPNGTTLGSMPHAEKQKGGTPPDQSSYQNDQQEPEMTPLPEREEVESSSSKKEETVVEIKKKLMIDAAL
ncbi:homeobox protein NOBOX isoform 1-T1 [Ara ararauna]